MKLSALSNEWTLLHSHWPVLNGNNGKARIYTEKSIVQAIVSYGAGNAANSSHWNTWAHTWSLPALRACHSMIGFITRSLLVTQLSGRFAAQQIDLQIELFLPVVICPKSPWGSPSTGYNYTTITPILYMTIPMNSAIYHLLIPVIAIQIG
jgi:hypothetical protein